MPVPVGVGLGSVIVGALVLGGYATYGYLQKLHPPIYDVSTDWVKPVTFSDRLIKERGPKALPIEDDPIIPAEATHAWARKSVAYANAKACPQAKPILRMLPEAEVVSVLQAQGYVIYGKAPWRVEATYTEPFFGITHDVEVRLNPTRTDVRSVSRRFAR